jgi:formylglycine-generating enzyme required for sulfatase activity
MARGAFLPALLAIACYSAGAPAPEQPAAHRGVGKLALISTVHAATPRVASRQAHLSEPASLRQRAELAACPDDMAPVTREQGKFCIDRWEASLVQREDGGGARPWPGNQPVRGREAELAAVSIAGRKPQAYISGTQAARACANAGKRLCELDEWVRACRGPRGYAYPYGDQRRPDVCNDRYRTLDAHPVQTLFERFAAKGSDRRQMWEAEWMNDPRLYDLPRSVEPAGARAECRSEHGVYDLVGNLHEWVADPEGTFVGGFFMDTFQNGEGCGYRTRAHGVDYHDYSTGFRCCRDQ